MSSRASTTLLTIAAPSSSLADATPSPSDATAPLLKLLPYLYSALSIAYAGFKSILQLSRHFWLPVPIILYVLAPITVFLSYLASVFIFAPYRTLAYLLEALHPLYVFCGVACLTGALLGLIGRVASALVISAFLPPLQDQQVTSSKMEAENTKAKTED